MWCSPKCVFSQHDKWMFCESTKRTRGWKAAITTHGFSSTMTLFMGLCSGGKCIFQPIRGQRKQVGKRQSYVWNSEIYYGPPNESCSISEFSNCVYQLFATDGSQTTRAARLILIVLKGTCSQKTLLCWITNNYIMSLFIYRYYLNWGGL